MDRRVYLLALAPLSFGTGAFGFTAVLEALAADLDVSLGEAGQVASALAVTLALTAPVLAAFTAGVERRRLLTLALLLFALACGGCALAPDYPALLGFRVGAGLAGGLIGPVATAFGAGLVAPEKRGTALAVVGAGISLSFIVGAPLSAIVGNAFGWRGAFVLAAGFALLTAGVLRAVLPLAPARPGPGGLRAFALALRPDVAPWLVGTAMVFMATQVTIAYLAPVARIGAGVTGGAVGAIQACIGLGSLAGLAVGARVAGRAGFVLPGFFLVIALTQAGYVALLLRMQPGPEAVVALVLLVLVGAGALFGSGPVLQARLLEAAGPAAPFALALNVSMVFLGQGLGAALGGLVVDRLALTWVGAAGTGVALVGAALACVAERRSAPGRGPAVAPA